MKLLIRRSQRPGALAGVVFQLEVRAEMSAEDKATIDKYRLGNDVLYQRDKNVLTEETFVGFAKVLAKHAMNITVKVADLRDGKRIECKSIVEMMAVEEQLKYAASVLSAIMQAATGFGGEEVVEL